MFLDRFFRQRQERKRSEERYQRYASKQEEFYLGLPEKNPEDEIAAHREVVESCEQMIELSREIEDARQEFEQVNDYVNDIRKIEALSEEDFRHVRDTAQNIINLHKSKEEFYRMDRKITDSQFTMMQQIEGEIKTVLKRFETNETYLDAVNHDLRYLEGEKMEWDIVRQECVREQTFLRRFSIVLLVLFVAGVVSLFVVGEVFQLNLQLEFMGLFFAAALLGAFVLFKFQDSGREIRRCEVNRNYAITLENRVKFKYVNTKNAIDYTCEKYHVNNSKELAYIYEAYLETVREQDRMRQMNEDMAYYENHLLNVLESFQVKDSESWITNVKALVEEREMEEIKRGLLLRRKKLRDRIQYNIDALGKLRENVEANKEILDEENREQIEEIVKRIREVNQNLF